MAKSKYKFWEKAVPEKKSEGKVMSKDAKLTESYKKAYAGRTRRHVARAEKKEPKTKVKLTERPGIKDRIMHMATHCAQDVHRAVSMSDSAGWKGQSDVQYRIERLDWLVLVSLKCDYCGKKIAGSTQLEEPVTEDVLDARRNDLARLISQGVKDHRVGCKPREWEQEYRDGSFRKIGYEAELKAKLKQGASLGANKVVTVDAEVPVDPECDPKYPDWE